MGNLSLRVEIFPISRNYYDQYLRRLNSQNLTLRDEMILGKEEKVRNREVFGFPLNGTSGFGELQGGFDDDDTNLSWKENQPRNQQTRSMQQFLSGDWFAPNRRPK